MENIYGTSSQAREVYTLAADVMQGNSGGPIFDEGGHVSGADTVIYATNGGSVSIGFAI